jgi:hypothetical protein
MRRSLLVAVTLISCASRPDTPIEAPASAPTQACSDVATATLWLGEATPEPLQACDADTVAVALSQTHAWTLREGSLEGGAAPIALGDVSPTDVAAGYDATAFVLDGTAGALHRAEADRLAPLAQDDALEGGRAVIRIGGSLFVGTPRGISRVSLSDASVTAVHEGLDVLDLTVDDVGALLVLHSEGLARMLPSGDALPLTTNALDATRIAFDLGTAELITVNGSGAVGRVGYDSLTAKDTRPAKHGDMGPFETSGFILAGAEYWPHRGSTPANYPEEILWGFYPHEGEVFEGSPAVATATPAAIACAEQSFAALQAWIPTATEPLAAATATGKAPRFYLWVNDYSEADDPFPAEMRQAKLWYWARNPGVPGRIPGYFKWETVLDQKGECHWPKPDQAAAFLTEAAAK